jgi:hypothetical protein
MNEFEAKFVHHRRRSAGAKTRYTDASQPRSLWDKPLQHEREPRDRFHGGSVRLQFS